MGRSWQGKRQKDNVGMRRTTRLSGRCGAAGWSCDPRDRGLEILCVSQRKQKKSPIFFLKTGLTIRNTL